MTKDKTQKEIIVENTKLRIEIEKIKRDFKNKTLKEQIEIYKKIKIELDKFENEDADIDNILLDKEKLNNDYVLSVLIRRLDNE